MPHAIRFHKTGGPEVLQWEEVAVGDPGPGEARIAHKAVGLNYIDTYHRTGLYPMPLPSGLGLEASGVVEAVGAGVTDLKAGDRVAYCNGPVGAYAEVKIHPAGKSPENSDFKQLAKILRSAGYRGYIVLEFEETGDPRAECRRYLDELRAAFA